MKKTALIISLFLLLAVITGCQTTQNRGAYNFDATSDGIPATVMFDSFVVTATIDGEEVNWSRSSWSERNQVQLTPGIHTFGLIYHDNQGQYTTKPQQVIVLLEAGLQYKVIPEVSFMMVHFDVIETVTQKSVKIDMDTLYGKAANQNFMSNFIEAVLNPTMDGTEQTVIEECDEFILINMPDMKFTLIDKATDEVRYGHRGFTTDFSFSKGTVYLKFDDGTVTREAFLASNYTDEADIIMVVADCDKETVTYTFIRPEELTGQNITMTISSAEAY